MRRVTLLSYRYPDGVRVMVGPSIYTYRASEPKCRRLISGLKYGKGFRSLNQFKKSATLIGKETTNEKGTAGMLPEG